MKKPKSLFRRLNGGRHRGRRREPFYDSGRWKKFRKEVLSEQPICADPFGIHKEHGEVVASTQVDHIIARRDRLDLELVLDNAQGVCHSCHSKKTREEMQSRGLS